MCAPCLDCSGTDAYPIGSRVSGGVGWGKAGLVGGQGVGGGALTCDSYGNQGGH